MGVKMVLKSSVLIVNSNDLSAYCSKIEVAAQVEEKDVTTFASGGWKEVTGGLFSAGINATFFNDVSASALDSIIWALFIAGVPTAFETRLTSSVVGTSNPKYTGSVLVSKWNPISGTVGDVDGVDVSWPTSGVVTRATS